MKNLIKTFVAALLLIAFAASLTSCRKNPTQEPTPVPTAAPTDAPNTTPNLPCKELALAYGMVVASESASFGVKSNGNVSFIGNNIGQAYVRDWRNVAKLVTNGTTTVALTLDGTILISSATDAFDAALEWEGVVDIAINNTALFAVTSDDKVLAVITDGSSDESAQSQLLDGFTNVLEVAAAADYMLALLKDGTVTAYGSSPALDAFEGEAIGAIAAAGDFAVALTDGGRLLTTESENAFLNIENIEKVYAFEGVTACIDESGSLHTNSALLPDGLGDVLDVSEANGHALALMADGMVNAYGNNDFLQCDVEHWRLCPYIDENGLILGLSVGETIDGTVVATGAEYTLLDGTVGTAVILGDVDSNGTIDESDIVAIEKYLYETQELSAAQLRAANVIVDSSMPDSIDIVDIEQIRNHILGRCRIDQYASENIYSGRLADAERINADTLGYIELLGTNIEYPIMYGASWYYNDHNLMGMQTTAGSLYFYWDMPTRNIVFTGHNARTSGTMLHELHKIQDEMAKDFDVFANRIWTVNAYGETLRWEVFAMYEETPRSENQASLLYNTCFNKSMDDMSESEIQEWINYQLERSELDYEVHVTTNDYFLTILTCGDRHSDSRNGARIYYFLRLVG